MVLLPLPLSPARATISRSPMSRLTSSTACRVRRDSAPPILKCLLSPAVRSSGPVLVSSGPSWAGASLIAAAFLRGHAPRGAAAGRHAAHAAGGGAGRLGTVAEILIWTVIWTVQETADLHRPGLVKLGRRGPALLPNLGAARGEPGGRPGCRSAAAGARGSRGTRPAARCCTGGAGRRSPPGSGRTRPPGLRT